MLELYDTIYEEDRLGFVVAATCNGKTIRLGDEVCFYQYSYDKNGTVLRTGTIKRIVKYYRPDGVVWYGANVGIEYIDDSGIGFYCTRTFGIVDAKGDVYRVCFKKEVQNEYGVELI